MCTLSEQEMVRLAQRSIDAETGRTEIDPITATYPELTIAQGYAIQKARENILLAEGKRLVGGKMGLTSLAKMEQMGAKESTYGKLFDYMQLSQGQPLLMEESIHPRIESEIAFVMERDLCGPHVTSADVMAATAYVVPAFEIIDSRYRDFKFKNPDSVADNLSAFRFLLGTQQVLPRRLDMRCVGVTISFNGEDRIFAASGAVLGHPARAIAAYVNLISRQGDRLKSGEVVLSGAITAATPLHKGDHVRAEFQGMGCVELTAH